MVDEATWSNGSVRKPIRNLPRIEMIARSWPGAVSPTWRCFSAGISLARAVHGAFFHAVHDQEQEQARSLP